MNSDLDYEPFAPDLFNNIRPQEIKPYKNEPEIRAMTSLIVPYQNNDMREFEKAYQENKNCLMSDPFIGEHICDLINNVRVQVLLLLVKSYRKVRLSFVSSELGIPKDEAECLIVSCILNGDIKGRLDQINQVLVTSRGGSAKERAYEGIACYAEQVDRISRTIVGRISA